MSTLSTASSNSGEQYVCKLPGCFPGKSIGCFALLLLLVGSGCSHDSSLRKELVVPESVSQQATKLNPWVVQLLASNVGQANDAIGARLRSDMPELQPLVELFIEFKPTQIEFSWDVGYLRCLREHRDPATDQVTTQVLYLAEPLPTEILKRKIEYFSPSVQELVAEFLTRFAGSGEEMEGRAGQFALFHTAKASELISSEKRKLGSWANAVLLYAAMNGDTVFINAEGSTLWHVLETDEVIPIAKSFTDFVRIYAEFRRTGKVFDSWNYREHIAAAKQQG